MGPFFPKWCKINSNFRVVKYDFSNFCRAFGELQFNNDSKITKYVNMFCIFCSEWPIVQCDWCMAGVSSIFRPDRYAMQRTNYQESTYQVFNTCLVHVWHYWKIYCIAFQGLIICSNYWSIINIFEKIKMLCFGCWVGNGPRKNLHKVFDLFYFFDNGRSTKQMIRPYVYYIDSK